MSIKDAEHIPSWQIGFEDGVTFASKIIRDLEGIKKSESKKNL